MLNRWMSGVGALSPRSVPGSYLFDHLSAQLRVGATSPFKAGFAGLRLAKSPLWVVRRRTSGLAATT
jgi:hypothetical protein